MTEILNPATMPSSGRIPYLARAATQDSHEAMGGDIIRALVELILNSDDSYERLGRGGNIWIGVDRSRTSGYSRVLVGDAAEGMSADVIARRLLAAGARASGHSEGKAVRGLHGRGAKDTAAFGRAVFETIRDGMYATVTVLPDLNYTALAINQPATEADWRRLRLDPGTNGTLVTLYVERPRFLLPRQANLASKLATHYQLRDLMQAASREVWLYDLGSAGESPTRLRYQPPAGREVKDVPISVPGYPAAAGRLRITRVERKLEEDRTPFRQGGILIAGRRALYDVTFFGLEGRSGSLYFHGRLDLPYIDQLQDEYDDEEENGLKHSPANPTPLITRRRDGLSHQHPFFVALREQVDKVLRPLVDKEEAGEADRRGELNENTRRRLREAARQLGRIFEEVQREDEVEVPPEGPEDVVDNPSLLQVIPETNRLQPGETKVFSIRAWPETFEPGTWPDPPIARCRITDEPVATLSAEEVELTSDPAQPRRYRASVRVTAGDDQDATFLEVTLGPQSAPAIVEVVEPEPEPTRPPDRLAFEYATITLKATGSRRVLLRSPAPLVDAGGVLVVRDVPGVFRAAVDDAWTRKESEGQHWYERTVTLEPLGIGVGRVRAELSGSVATARVQVSEREGGLPFAFDVQDRAPLYESIGRAEWSTIKGDKTLVILAGHPSLKRYFGDQLKEQDTPICQALVAEVIADALATEAMSRRERARGEALFRDAQGYSTEHRRLMGRFLNAAHKVLVNKEAGR